MAWTDERVELLKKLWADGLSASAVAAELGGFGHCSDGGRSAVIGKVCRLGLCGRKTLMRSKPGRRKEPRSDKPPPKLAAAVKASGRGDHGGGLQQKIAAHIKHIEAGEQAMVELPPDESTFAVTFEALRSDQCRWPMGDLANLETFRFCGGPQRDPKCPYCARHAMVGGAGYGARPSAPSDGSAPAKPRASRDLPVSPFTT